MNLEILCCRGQGASAADLGATGQGGRDCLKGSLCSRMPDSPVGMPGKPRRSKWLLLSGLSDGSKLVGRASASGNPSQFFPDFCAHLLRKV